MLARLTRCGCRAADISRRHTFFFFFFFSRSSPSDTREKTFVLFHEQIIWHKKKELFLCVCLSAAINTTVTQHISVCVCVCVLGRWWGLTGIKLVSNRKACLRACELARAGMYTLSKSNPPESNELLELLK